MTRKILSFLLAVCILISPLAYGISYTEEYTTTTPMQSEAATAGSSLNYQVFRQTDQNYGNYDPSGGAGCTIQKNGCGIMSIVNAVYHLNGNIISLKDLFTWAYSTGGYGTAGTTRYTIYPALQAAFGAKYGFTVGTMQYGKVSDATFTNHIKNGGTAIVHVYNHFMCIAGYDAASGRYLLIDPAPNWDNRHSSAGGNWMTAAELTGGINSHYLTIDWYCLLSNATASGTKYTATANVAGGSGSVFFYDDVSSAKFTAGTTVFFRPVPASGYKVTSVVVNGSALAVQNGGNPSIYAFTMPSANCTINVGFSTGGAGHANATYTSAASYALPAGIVARTDSARPNSYVGLFTNATTTYSKSTAIVYFSAPAYYYIGNSKAEGFTTQLQAGKMGGNCGAYGSTGTFKVVTFNTSGTAHSVATISISGSDAHAAAITYGRGVTDNTGGGTTGGGTTGGSTTTLYTVTASVASGSGSVHFGNGVTSAQVYAGTVVNYQVTPASGYKATKILVYGTSQTIKSGGGDAVYQFTMEAANATVSVTFTKDTTTLYSLTAKVASGSGSVHFGNGVTSVQAAAGQVVNYQVTPASGWKTSSITVGGTAVTVQNGGVDHVYQLTMPSGACEVSVKFTSTVTATDIVFDNSTTVNWAKGSTLQATTISLGTCPAGDATMVVKTSAAHNDPQFHLNYSTFGTVSASSYKYMIVTAKTSAANKNAKVYLCPGSITGPTEDCAKSWQWTNDGLWHDYIIDLSGLSTWTGNLNQIRFDYFDGDTASGSTLYLRSIRFTTSKPSTPKVTTDKTTYKLGETITVSYSGLGSYLSSAQNMKPFVGLYKKGTSPGSTASHYWALALSSSGTIDFPDQATAGANLPTTGLTAGDYVMWIAYDAYGTSASANLNNCKFASSSASYSITITEAAYSLTASAGTGGKVHFGNDVTSTVVGPGTIVNYQTTPNTGYKVSKITINGVSQTIQNGGADCVYQFEMPAEDVTISVTFTKLTYKITVTTPTNGTVTLKDASGNTISSGSSVAYGTVITVTATPSTGYKLSSLKAGSTSLSSGGTFTVSAATTVTATFAKKTYAITITNPTGATITLKDASGNAVASGATVAHGTVLTVTLTPSSGYRVKTVTIGGTAKQTYTTMSTTAVTYSHTVSAATTISGTAGKIFKVSYSQATGGTIAVANNSSGAAISSGSYVDTGTVIKVTVTEATGYNLSTLKAGSTSISNGGTYTVSAATTVAATYVKEKYTVTISASNGTVTLKDASGNAIASGASVEYGTKITVTATPSTGYKLSTLKYGSTSISSGGTFTLTAATTVTGTFTKQSYTMTITNPTGGTITVTDASGNAVTSGTAVAYKSVLTVTLTPSSGYRVKTITVDGTSKKTNSTISNAAVTYSYTVGAAAFTLSGTCGKIYKVSYSQATGGTIAVTNNSSGAAISSGSYVDTGTVIKVTVTESTGYDLSTLKAGSTTLTNGGTYTVSAATTVAATYVKEKYTVTISASNGTVTLKDASGNAIASGASVEYGTVITVTATPATGYKLSTLKAGSTSLSSGGTFTLTAATTVTGTFTKQSYTMTITNPTGGTITVTDASGNAVTSGTAVAYKSVLTVTLTPSSGYRVKTITVDGTSKKTNSTISNAAVTYSYTVGAAAFTLSGTCGKIYKVSYSQATGGTIAVTNNSSGAAISSGSYVDTGTVIKVTVTEATGYNLSTLKAGSTSIDNGGTYTVSAATTVAATYVKETYKVTVTTPSNGTVTLKDASGNTIASGDSVEYGTVITVTATPSTGYQLSSLKAGSTSLSSGGTFTVSAATTITATFTQKTYAVTITNPTGATITLKDASGNAVASGATVPHGTVLTVTLTPSSGYRVKTVTVDGTSKKTFTTMSTTAVTYSHTVTSADTISGTAGKIFKVSFSQVTGGTIAVTNNSSGAAISSGSFVDTGTVIKVSVTEATGYNLSTLKAGSTSIDNGGTYTVSAATTVAATYVKETYKVTVSTPSNGTVTLKDASGNTIASGSSVEYGTVITVTATPSTGYQLSTLKAGNTSLSSGGTFTVSAATTVTATFTQKTYAITITNPTGGTITVKDASGNAIASGATVPHGSVLTVTLTPSSGYRVKTITAGGSSIKSNSTISTAAVSGTHTVTGAITYSGTVGKIYKVSYSQATGGTIAVTNNSTGAAISSGSYVDTGTVIKVSVTEATGYDLSTLKAGSTTLTNGGTYTVSAATTVAATYVKEKYTVTVTTPSNGTVTLKDASGNTITSGSSVEYGTVITVTATPSTGYQLSSLKAGSTSLSSGGTFTVSAATTITATFTQKTYAVTITNPTGGTITVKDASGNAIASGSTVPHGSVLTVTLTPSSGYRVKTITAGGSSIKSNSTISTAAVSGTHTVTGAITYSGTVGKIYKVSYSQVTGGTIAVTNNSSGAAISSGSYVDTGTVIKVTVTEATGYNLSTLKAGSTSIDNGGTYTVSAATTVAATYVKETYKVTVTTPSNGTVTLKDASGNTITSGSSVEYGTVITVTATPSTGYKLSTLKAGSTSLSSGGTFTVSAATTVTATFTAIPYNVTISVAGGSGTAKFSDGTTATTATIGQSVSYTLTPATGYKVSKITVNGTSVSVTNSGATATYTLTMTAEDTTISVTFAKKTYAVSVGEVTNGTVTLSSTGNIAYNTTITVTATPATGYELDQILVNGTAISGTTFKVTKASTVTATFKKIQCAVSVGTVSNGKVTISPTGTVDHGTTITVTATPATGYKLNQILVNGTAIEGTTFTVTEAATVTATFTKLTYKVSVGTVSNGTVTLSKIGTVDHGTTITVTATPATGYKLNQILVNGTAITGTTFTVTEAATVTATFTKLTYNVSVGTVSNGTVTLSNTGAVEHGTTITVTATAADGYELNQILVNGTAITGTTFTVTEAATVTATFTKTVVEEPTYTITIVKGGKGTGNVTVVASAKAGETITLTTAGTVNTSGLACVTTLIESADVTLTTSKVVTSALTGATFTMPAKNVTITVNFQILGDADLNGRINVSDTRAVKAHASKDTLLTGEKLIVANVAGTSNATVNVMDTRAVKAVASKETTIFQNGSY